MWSPLALHLCVVPALFSTLPANNALYVYAGICAEPKGAGVRGSVLLINKVCLRKVCLSCCGASIPFVRAHISSMSERFLACYTYTADELTPLYIFELGVRLLLATY